MRALACVIFAIAASAAGAGFEIAPPERASTAGGMFPSVASNGAGFFVAWRDRVDEAAAIAIDGSGAPSSPVPFPLFTGNYLGSVVPFGSNYLFVTRNASGDTLLNEVNTAGFLVRTFRADVPPNNGLIASATPDGSRVLLTDGLRVFVVDGNGRRLRETTLSGEIRDLRITGSAGGFVLSGWTDDRPFVQRIGRDGTASAPVLLDNVIAGNLQIGVAAADAGNGNIMAVWAFRLFPVEVNVAVVNAAGAVTQRVELPYFGYPYVAPRALLRTGDTFTLVADVGKFDVQPSDYLTLAVLRLDAAGNPLDGAPLTVANSAVFRQTESVAYNGNRFYAVSTEELALGRQVKGISFRVDNGIRDVREDLLSIARAEQIQAVIAAGTTDFIAVWREFSAEREELRAARFDVGDPPVTTAPFVVSSSSSIGTFDVGSGGGIYVIAWTEGSQLLAERVGHDGLRLDTTPILIRAGNVQSPAIAWNGKAFGMVWTENGRLFGATVQPNGSVSAAREVTPPASLGGADGLAQINPQLAWDGTAYILAWTLFSQGNVREARTAIVSEELVAIAVSDTFIGSDLLVMDIAAGDGDSVLVARGPQLQLVAVRLSSTGAPIATSVIATGPVQGGSIAWDSRDYLITWSDLAKVGAVSLTRLSGGSATTTRTESARVAGAPQIAVNNTLGELAIVVSEVRADDERSVATQRIIAYDEQDFGVFIPDRPGRGRIVQR